MNSGRQRLSGTFRTRVQVLDEALYTGLVRGCGDDISAAEEKPGDTLETNYLLFCTQQSVSMKVPGVSVGKGLGTGVQQPGAPQRVSLKL